MSLSSLHETGSQIKQKAVISSVQLNNTSQRLAYPDTNPSEKVHKILHKHKKNWACAKIPVTHYCILSKDMH
jgi:hypothetical protein